MTRVGGKGIQGIESGMCRGTMGQRGVMAFENHSMAVTFSRRSYKA